MTQRLADRLATLRIPDPCGAIGRCGQQVLPIGAETCRVDGVFVTRHFAEKKAPWPVTQERTEELTRQFRVRIGPEGSSQMGERIRFYTFGNAPIQCDKRTVRLHSRPSGLLGIVKGHAPLPLCRFTTRDNVFRLYGCRLAFWIGDGFRHPFFGGTEVHPAEEIAAILVPPLPFEGSSQQARVEPDPIEIGVEGIDQGPGGFFEIVGIASEIQFSFASASGTSSASTSCSTTGTRRLL